MSGGAQISASAPMESRIHGRTPRRVRLSLGAAMAALDIGRWRARGSATAAMATATTVGAVLTWVWTRNDPTTSMPNAGPARTALLDRPAADAGRAEYGSVGR